MGVGEKVMNEREELGGKLRFGDKAICTCGSGCGTIFGIVIQGHDDDLRRPRESFDAAGCLQAV